MGSAERTSSSKLFVAVLHFAPVTVLYGK